MRSHVEGRSVVARGRRTLLCERLRYLPAVDHDDPPRRGRTGGERAFPGFPLIVGTAVAVVAVWIFHAGRGTTFFFDEWNVLLDRRGGLAPALLEPHNGHLSVVPFALYRLALPLVGATYEWYRSAAVAAHLLCVATVYAFARTRLGRVGAALAAGFVLVLGVAWQDLLWPFQIGYFLSVAGGVTALRLAGMDTPGARRGTAAGLGLALASSGLGIPFAAAVTVHAALARQWSRWWTVALPGAAYAVWYLAYGESEATAANLARAPRFAVAAAAAASGSLVGRPTGVVAWTAFAVIAAVGLVAVAVSRRLPPRLAATVIGAGVFWGLTGLTRAGIELPNASRYLYPGAVFVVLALVDAAALLAVRWSTVRTVAAVVVAVALVAGAGANATALERGGRGLRETSDYVRAELAVLDGTRGLGDDSFRPDEHRMPQVRAGAYLDFVDDIGSPAYTPAEVAARPRAVRHAADLVVVRRAGIDVRPATREPAGCTPLVGQELNAGTGPVAVYVDASAAAVEVRARVFASPSDAIGIALIERGTRARISAPSIDRLGRWHFLFTPSGRICIEQPAA